MLLKVKTECNRFRTIEIVEEENDLVAYGTTGQSGVFKGFQTKIKSDDNGIVQINSTNLIESVTEKEFEKQFSIVCPVVQKPTYIPAFFKVNARQKVSSTVTARRRNQDGGANLLQIQCSNYYQKHEYEYRRRYCAP